MRTLISKREDIVIIQDMVDANLGVSMRAIARDVGCSDWLVKTIVKEDLYFKSYSLRMGQFMNQATKERTSSNTLLHQTLSFIQMKRISTRTRR